MNTVGHFLRVLLAVFLCMSAPAGAELIQHLDASGPESVVLSGNVVQRWNDLSGKGNDAVVTDGTVTYPSVAFPGGPVGLDFGPDRSVMELFSSDESDSWLDQSAGTGGFTVIAVSYTSALGSAWNDLIGNTSAVAQGWGFRYHQTGQYQVYLHGTTGGNSPTETIEAGDTIVWTHTYNAATGASELWTNQGDPRTATKAAADFSRVTPVTLGATTSGSRYFQGFVGEVMVFDAPLSQAELEQLRSDLVYKWVIPLEEKLAPGALLPADGSVEMPLDGATLSWKAGMDSTAQDVYFGTDFEDVNSATPDNDPAGVYMGRQSEETFALPTLDYGQTYYWRIDSINGAAYSSAVASFDTIKYAYPMAGEYIIATASSSIEDVNAVNTVNGAGLDVNDRHNTNLEDMWLSNLVETGTPVWIQYDFGALVKLNEMLVWNHNTLVENLMGWGIKETEIEYTADGATWLPLTEQAVTFEKGPGADGYAANTAIAFNDWAVQGVRINALSNFEGIVPLNMYGLSEVQFLTVPVQAADPAPANGQVGQTLDPTVSWSAGRGSVSHDLYVSDDPIAVSDETIDPIAVGLTATTYDLAGLDVNTVYYWKVNEIGDTEAWPGYVWSFATVDSIVVDDMESYEDVAGSWIWQTWADGFEDPANGATVGIGDLPETDVVWTGNQSLPMAFDNSSSPLSEATRAFDPAQDWTQSGIQKLMLYYQFSPESTGGEFYVKINGVKVAAVPVAVVEGWSSMVVDLAAAGMDLSKVGTLTIGVDGTAAKGVVYVDDIVLTK